MIRFPWQAAVPPDACPNCGSVHHVCGEPVQVSYGGISRSTGSKLKCCVACRCEWYAVGGQSKRVGRAQPALPADTRVDFDKLARDARKALADAANADKPAGFEDMRLR